MAMFKIPPLGFVGNSQQTQAQQLLTRQVLGSGTRTNGTRRRRKAKAAPTARRRVRRAASKASKFVKGSAAAKRHMARLRKMRKR